MVLVKEISNQQQMHEGHPKTNQIAKNTLITRQNVYINPKDTSNRLKFYCEKLRYLHKLSDANYRCLVGSSN